MSQGRFDDPLSFHGWDRIPKLIWRAVSIGQGFIASFLIAAVLVIKYTAINVELQKRLFDTYRGFFNQPNDLHLF